MSDIAVRIDGLGKKYRIGGTKTKYKTLRSSLTDMLTLPARRVRNLLSGGAAGSQETIWAIRNIGFDVKQGEVVGIVGHNGAGKSTLLKILSRITIPTEGRAEIYGR